MTEVSRNMLILASMCPASTAVPNQILFGALRTGFNHFGGVDMLQLFLWWMSRLCGWVCYEKWKGDSNTLSH
jgi:hypothetical protein